MELLTAHSSAALIHLEDRYNAHNYHPLPVVLERGQGVHGVSSARDEICHHPKGILAQQPQKVTSRLGPCCLERNQPELYLQSQ